MTLSKDLAGYCDTTCTSHRAGATGGQDVVGGVAGVV